MQNNFYKFFFENVKKVHPLFISFLQNKIYIFLNFYIIYVLGHIFSSIKRNLLFLEAQQNLDQAGYFTVVVYMNYVVKKFKNVNLKLVKIF